jgi:antibiotic biosynthesis monooxygenase (ABM) superfamily enzyme
MVPAAPERRPAPPSKAKEWNVEVHACRTSAVIVQRVPPAAVERFLEWQRGVTAGAEGFAGYRATDIYPPAEGQQEEWVVVIQFDDNESLQRWLNAPMRQEWLARLPREVGADYRLKTLPGGFGPWFARLAREPDGAPPAAWKMALTVLLGLYPTVMLLTLFPGPFLTPLGLAVSMLVGNALSVSILQWAVMPVLSALLAPWLKARTEGKRAFSLGGACLILLVLAGLAGLFRRVTG